MQISAERLVLKNFIKAFIGSGPFRRQEIRWAIKSIKLRILGINKFILDLAHPNFQKIFQVDSGLLAYGFTLRFFQNDCADIVSVEMERLLFLSFYCLHFCVFFVLPCCRDLLLCLLVFLSRSYSYILS